MGDRDGMEAPAGYREMAGSKKSMTREFRLLLACARVLPTREDEAAIRGMQIHGIDWTLFAADGDGTWAGSACRAHLELRQARYGAGRNTRRLARECGSDTSEKPCLVR